MYLAGEVAWVRWPSGRAEFVRCLLPVSGVTFFSRRDGLWFPFGSRLPTNDAPPDGDGLPAAAILVPRRFEPILPEAVTRESVLLRVVRGGGTRPSSALVCTIGALLKWANAATTAELAAVRAARSDDRVILLGGLLPSIPAATRYWGDDILVPIGFRPEPDLPAVALREVAGAAADELLLLDESGAEVIPRTAFEPLTRAGIRLAARPA